MVSLAILLDNIAEVSDKFNLAPEVAPVAKAKAPTFCETYKVVAIVLSAVAVSCVTVTGRPLIMGDVIILLVSVSAPASVAKVPEVGKVTLLAAVVVITKSPIPFVAKLFAMEIVLPLLLIPVPPFVLGKIVVIVVAESEANDLPAT